MKVDSHQRKRLKTQSRKGEGMKGQEHIRGWHTLGEITSQAVSWEGVFRRIDGKVDQLIDLYENADEILFSGCGSACNVCHAVAPFFQENSGKTCRAVHSSDIVINPDSSFNKKRNTLVVAYSRSGDTTESVRALDTAMQRGASVLSITCFKQSQMSVKATEALVLEEASEKSVATTRSLTSMILAGYYLAAVLTRNESIEESLKMLPHIVRDKIDEFHQLGKKIGEDEQIEKYAFLGSGSYYGLAREAQLKVKEMVLLPSDSYVSLDFQHGPMSNVDERMLVTIMVSDRGKLYDRELVKNMKSLGGRVFVICDSADRELRKHADFLLELNTGLGDGLRNILYMPVLQFMAYYKSLARGNDPDNPKNLHYFVELEER